MVLITEKWSTRGRFLLLDAAGEEDSRESGGEGQASFGREAYVLFTLEAIVVVQVRKHRSTEEAPNVIIPRVASRTEIIVTCYAKCGP